MKNLWIFRFFFIKRLLEQKESGFKVKNETDAIKAACIDNILERTKPLLQVAKILVHRISIKSVQDIRTRTFRGDFITQSLKSIPLFSQNEIASFTKKYYINLVCIIGFIVCESGLFFVIIPLYLPSAPLVTQIIVSFTLSALVICGLNYGAEKHFAYRNAVLASEGNEISLINLKEYRDKKQLGYLLIVLSLIVTISVAFARLYFLETIDPSGLDAPRLQSVQRASFFASIGTLAITVVAGILLALIKYDQSKESEKYHVYRYWRRMHKRRNKYIRQLITIAQELLAIIDREINKHWQLAIDLKRVFRMQHEFDDKYEELYQEYQREKDAEDFIVTETLYRKYSYIQCSEEALFKFGIRHSKEIKPIIMYYVYLLKLPEEHITSELSGTRTSQTELSPESHTLNGKDTKHHFITPTITQL